MLVSGKKTIGRKFIYVFIMAIVFSMLNPVPAINQVTAVQAASKVKLNKTKASIVEGKTVQLKLQNATGTVSWASSNKKVAKVSSKGKVTGVKAGTATITAIYKGNSYTCKITVKKDKQLSAEEVYEKCSGSVVTVLSDKSQGSGFFIDKYTLVTNFHVIESAKYLLIELKNKKQYKVTQILGYDPRLDIAILKTEYKGKALTLNTHKLKTGETVYTLGSPRNLADTFAKGIISNPNRDQNGVKVIQTDAAISPGNSGGPLINSYGEVVGINTRTRTDAQNINFAVNIDQVKLVDTSKPLTVEEYSADKFRLVLDNIKHKGAVSSKSEGEFYLNYSTKINNNSYKFTLFNDVDSKDYSIDFFIVSSENNNYSLSLGYYPDDSSYYLVFGPIVDGKRNDYIKGNLDCKNYTGTLKTDNFTFTVPDGVDKDNLIIQAQRVLNNTLTFMESFLKDNNLDVTLSDLMFKKYGQGTSVSTVLDFIEKNGNKFSDSEGCFRKYNYTVGNNAYNINLVSFQPDTSKDYDLVFHTWNDNYSFWIGYYPKKNDYYICFGPFENGKRTDYLYGYIDAKNFTGTLKTDNMTYKAPENIDKKEFVQLSERFLNDTLKIVSNVLETEKLGITVQDLGFTSWK